MQNASYFTFDEGNNELIILKVAEADAQNVNTSELSYYGGKWRGPIARNEVLVQLGEFLVANQSDDPQDDDEPNAVALAHFTKLIDDEEVIELDGESVDVWDLRGEDEDCGVMISGDDVSELL